jgi:rhamnosyltransferase subunit B
MEAQMARIVIATVGSYGDLFPYLALAQGLQARGHTPVLAVTPHYADKVAAAGVEFAPIRPDVADFGDFAEVMRKSNDPQRGTEFVIRELAIPSLRHAYADFLVAARGADLVVSQQLSLAAPIAATKMGLPWVATALSPISFGSQVDPSIIAQGPWLHPIQRRIPWLGRAIMSVMRRVAGQWSRPIHAFRREVGLPPIQGEPLLEGQFSPYLNLALFSRHFAQPATDWPANTAVTGFLFYDAHDDAREDLAAARAALADFVAHQGAPIVLALGSTAVYDAGDFYAEGIRAARAVERPAVLLTGRDPANRPTSLLGEDTLVLEYMPYTEVFPLAAVTVHHGGIGTLAQALRAGKPTLVVPYTHDQPDNAHRVQKLGTTASVLRTRFNAQRCAQALRALLDDPSVAMRAEQLGATIRGEDGVAAACEALEGLL